MKFIIGFDLGVTSIGWAIVEKDNNIPKRIVAIGSRLVPLNPDDKDEFSKGNAISKNQKRTLRRTQRKGYNRYQLRRTHLQALLRQLHMLPGSELVALPAINLYQLREKALSEQLSLEETGRVLLHLNQKRGYKSARTEANMDKKDTEYVADVKTRHQKIKDLGVTVGQYFYQGLLSASTYRVREQVFPREAYQDEFDAIMQVQSSYYPDILTQPVIDKLRNEIIFYQRPLKSQKGLVSVCEFEGHWEKIITSEGKEKELFVGPKVAPRSSPLAQVCKIWESINSIVLNNKRGDTYIISPEQKILIFGYLDQNKVLTTAELFKILQLKRADGWYSGQQVVKGIQGNITKVQLLACLKELNNKEDYLRFNLVAGKGKRIDKTTGEISDIDIITPSYEQEPLQRIWHIIYSLPDAPSIINTLSKQFDLPLPVCEQLSRLDFNTAGFGNKSSRAMRKILPGLQQGLFYSQACQLAGYNHSNSMTSAENMERQLLGQLPHLPKNSLRQPIVEKILNQLVNVTNMIIHKYGQPEEIRIELARELKQSKEERNNTFKNNNDRERVNKKIIERIEQDYQKRGNRRNIDKWKLYEETDGRCIYCNGGITLADFLNGEESDIEHLIPQASLFDDSLQNKSIAHRKCNAEKAKMTAYDYMKGKSDKDFEDYLERVEQLYTTKKISKVKRDRLLMAQDKIPTDFIDRQLRQTQYITRKSVEMLSQICRHVYTTTGSVTAYLRHTWGWDEVLMNLQLPKYQALGLTEWKEFEHNGQVKRKEVIRNWGKRDDHRHHAIDALVIACTSQGIIQRLNTLSQQTGSATQTGTSLEKHILSLKPFHTAAIEKAAADVLISFKPGKKVTTPGNRKIRKHGQKLVAQTGILIPRGSLSEESVYGKIKVMHTAQPVKALLEAPSMIVKERIRNLVEERLNLHQGDTKKAINSLKQNPIYLDPEQKTILTHGTIFKEEYVIKYPVQTIKKADLPSIVDKQVQAIITARLAQYNYNEKEAFKDLANNPVYLNEEKKITIRTVRCRTGLSAVVPVKHNEKEEAIGFVKPGNNHHIAIYKDGEGKLQEHVVTFWNAVERRKNGIPAVITHPQETWIQLEQLKNSPPELFLNSLPLYDWTFFTSLQQNEMFVLGLEPEAFQDAIRQNNLPVLSNHLYRIQKLAAADYLFRHHLETELIDTKEALSSKRFIRINSMSALLRLNPEKVGINIIGELTQYDKAYPLLRKPGISQNPA